MRVNRTERGGFLLNIDTQSFLIILIAIGMVFIVEIFNSAIEYLSDFVSSEYNETIKKVKDLSAAAVLIAAGIAVIVGVIIFMPKILELL